MNEITEKLHSKALEEFKGVIEPLAKEGLSQDQIVNYYKKWLQHKSDEFYRKSSGPQQVGNLIANLLCQVRDGGADSKAEMIFYEMLFKAKINFRFHYAIGPYTADYLVAGFLVVEIDGPQHDKRHDEIRDKYMRRLGYKIIRIPVWVLVSCPEAAIEEIKEAAKKVTR